MAPVLKHYLECKHGGCRQPIWLLDSILLERLQSLPVATPDALALTVARRECGHVYGYTQPDIQSRLFQNQDHSPAAESCVVEVRFGCAVETCKTVVTILVPSRTVPQRDELLREVLTWQIFAKCQNGHPVEVPQAGSFQVSRWA